MKFFYDTYALIEIHKGNLSYQPYAQGEFVLSYLNILELMYHFVRTGERQEGERYIRYLSAFVIDIPTALIWKAMELKWQKKSEDLSFTDCIGYIYAQTCGIKFLTGDERFRDRPQVEFVK